MKRYIEYRIKSKVHRIKYSTCPGCADRQVVSDQLLAGHGTFPIPERRGCESPDTGRGGGYRIRLVKVLETNKKYEQKIKQVFSLPFWGSQRRLVANKSKAIAYAT